MRVRVPASSANLGPGFDALAIALDIPIEVSIEVADELSLSAEGFGSELTDPAKHLGVSIATEILGHQNFSLHVNSSIPLARGLGSSAALAVAVAKAAGSLDPLAIGTRIDGHAENAAASLLGGFVTASVEDDEIFVASLPLDPALRFVVVIPERELATADARRVLPSNVSYHDAAFNLSRVALLTAGLADHTLLQATAMDDRLHQPFRMSLLPFAADVLRLTREAGALASCWSGAGSTMLAVATDATAAAVAEAARGVLHQHSEPGTVQIVEADRRGLQVL